MSLLPFMKQKATEKGLKQCPHCGKPDIFFALNGTCLECNNSIPRNDSLKTFQFAVEILTEFIDKYDDLTSREIKQPALDDFNAIVYTCNNNTPSNESLIKLKTFVNNVGAIGGNDIGGSVTIQKGEPSLQLLENYQTSGDPMARVKSLSAVILAIQFIQSFSLDSEPTNLKTPNREFTTRTTKKSASSSSGCMFLMAALLTAFVSLTILIVTAIH